MLYTPGEHVYDYLTVVGTEPCVKQLVLMQQQQGRVTSAGKRFDTTLPPVPNHQNHVNPSFSSRPHLPKPLVTTGTTLECLTRGKNSWHMNDQAKQRKLTNKHGQEHEKTHARALQTQTEQTS